MLIVVILNINNRLSLVDAQAVLNIVCLITCSVSHWCCNFNIITVIRNNIINNKFWKKIIFWGCIIVIKYNIIHRTGNLSLLDTAVVSDLSINCTCNSICIIVNSDCSVFNTCISIFKYNPCVYISAVKVKSRIVLVACLCSWHSNTCITVVMLLCFNN